MLKYFSKPNLQFPEFIQLDKKRNSARIYIIVYDSIIELTCLIMTVNEACPQNNLVVHSQHKTVGNLTNQHDSKICNNKPVGTFVLPQAVAGFLSETPLTTFNCNFVGVRGFGGDGIVDLTGEEQDDPGDFCNRPAETKVLELPVALGVTGQPSSSEDGTASVAGCRAAAVRRAVSGRPVFRLSDIRMTSAEPDFMRNDGSTFLRRSARLLRTLSMLFAWLLSIGNEGSNRKTSHAAGHQHLTQTPMQHF